MFDLSAYSLALFVHVLSAIVLVGSGLVAPLGQGFAVAAPSLAELRAHLEFARRSSRWNPLAAFVLLGSGVFLGSWGWWHTGWFYVAAAVWLANAVLAKAVVHRAVDTVSRAAARAGEGLVPPDVDRLRRARGWRVALAAMVANDFSILFVMYQKPSVVGAVIVVAVANVLAMALLAQKRASPQRQHVQQV